MPDSPPSKQPAPGPHRSAVSASTHLEIESLVRGLHAQHRGNFDGMPADYIPELSRVPPDQFGIAIANHAGEIVAAGDARAPFTIQSVSKALTFAMLLDTAGRDATYASVGVQPSGDPFNSITLDPRTNRPFNPMVNAGAIAVAGRLREVLGHTAFAQVLETFSHAAGRDLSVDERVFAS